MVLTLCVSASLEKLVNILVNRHTIHRLSESDESYEKLHIDRKFFMQFQGIQGYPFTDTICSVFLSKEWLGHSVS